MRLATLLAERALVPDALIELGIRLRLREAIRNAAEAATNGEEEAFRKELRECPIAIETEAANEQHYELPPAFFQTVLGPRLKYSSCLYETGHEELAAAEVAMLRLTCERAGIKNGMRVLDVGCGWGSLSLWIAEQYPQCEVVGVSNANNQRQHIESLAATRGLKNIRIITCDINQFEPEGLFDRVVSVEMFEHVRNHSVLLQRIRRWMRDDGRLFVHIFCHERHAYPYKTEGDANWMGRYFFTGGIMPSFDLLQSYPEHLRVSETWKVNGVHYGRTLRHWLQRMDANREKIMPLMRETYGDEATLWYQRWRIFFLACAELFEYNGGKEWYVAHYLFEPVAASVPLDDEGALSQSAR